MSSSTPPKGKQRKLHRKARTACRTCKLRHIKCDEIRPSCQRCLSSGRSCAGYDTEYTTQTVASTGTFQIRTWMQPFSHPPLLSQQEQAAIQFFWGHVADKLAGPVHSLIWHHHILPIFTTEPPVRHAIIALGSIRRHRDKFQQLESDCFALQHYSEAMRALNAKLAVPGQVSTILILATCLLFIAFEFQRRGWEQASSHLHGGLKIIRKLQNKPKSFAPLPKQSLEPLVEAFERLDIQMSLFTSSRVQLNQAVENAIMPSLPAQMTFKDVVEAGPPLNIQIAAMRELVYAIEMRRFSPEGISAENHSDFQVQLTRQLVSLSHWEQAMVELLPLLSCSNDRKSARLLQLHHLCCKLMVSASLTTGREVLWDSFHGDFKRLLEMAEDALSTTESPSHDDEHVSFDFSLDMGIIPPLYFTALKCRDPILRRRAIALLNECKHQEGAWNGPQIAHMGERIVKLEERGLGEIYHASQVPEQNLLYQAWYDLRHSSHVVYCKRRRFESDGNWIEFKEYVE